MALCFVGVCPKRKRGKVIFCLTLFYFLLAGCPELITDKDIAIETTKYSIVVYHKEDWSTASMVIEHIDRIVEKVGKFFPGQKLPKFYLVILPSNESVRAVCANKKIKLLEKEIGAFYREHSNAIVVSADALTFKQASLEILAHEVAHIFIKSHPDEEELVKQIVDRLYL